VIKINFYYLDLNLNPLERIKNSHEIEFEWDESGMAEETLEL